MSATPGRTSSPITFPNPKQARFRADGFIDGTILGDFFADASALLETLERDALLWEDDPANTDLGRSVRRALHTLKGNAGFVGLLEMQDVCHQAETLLGEAEGRCPTDMLLKTKDWLQAVMQHLRNGPVGEADKGPDAAAVAGSGRQTGDGGDLRFLIVECDISERIQLQTLLAPYGRCEIAADGEEAWEAFRCAIQAEHGYDLICLGMPMRRINGHEVLRRIRAWEQERDILLGRGVPIIMVGDGRRPKKILGAFNTGCDAYLTKPVKREKLLKEIRSLGLTK